MFICGVCSVVLILSGRPPSLASQLPQLECVHSVGDWSAGRPLSRASPLPQLECVHSGGDWSAGRPPSLASQLPPFDRVYSVGDWSAGRPLSRASSLPQLECVHSGGRLVGCEVAFASRLAPTVGMRAFRWEVGRLGGRHRWQASSHHLTECIQLGMGRLGGRFREQARSHRGALLFTK